MVEPIEVYVFAFGLLGMCIALWRMRSEDIDETEIPKVKVAVRGLCEERLIENGEYEFDFYYHIENGEEKEFDAKVQLESFPRDEESLPGYADCHGRPRPRRLVKKQGDPDWELEKGLTQAILLIARRLIRSRTSTRIIVSFENCDTKVSISA